MIKITNEEVKNVVTKLPAKLTIPNSYVNGTGEVTNLKVTIINQKGLIEQLTRRINSKLSFFNDHQQSIDNWSPEVNHAFKQLNQNKLSSLNEIIKGIINDDIANELRIELTDYSDYGLMMTDLDNAINQYIDQHNTITVNLPATIRTQQTGVEMNFVLPAKYDIIDKNALNEFLHHKFNPNSIITASEEINENGDIANPIDKYMVNGEFDMLTAIQLGYFNEAMNLFITNCILGDWNQISGHGLQWSSNNLVKLNIFNHMVNA